MNLGQRPTRLAPLVLLALACGSGGRDEFEGTWYFTDFAQMRACVETLELGYGEFVSTTACKMLDESVGEMITVGTYKTEDHVLRVTPDRSTCRDMPKTEATWRLVFDRQKLEKAVGNTTFTYRKARPNIPAGVRIKGCWDPTVTTFTDEPAGLVNLR